MITRFLILVLVAMSSVLGAQSRVRAQKPDAEYDKAIHDAVGEFQQGDWAEARTLFSHAHDLKPSARTERGLGLVEFELRHYVEATRFLGLALVDTRSPLTAAQRKDVTDVLARARAFIGRYHVRLEPVGTTLSVDAVGAQLESDGSLLVSVGDHTLSASAPGYAEQTLKLDVRGGEDQEIAIALQAAAAEVAPPPPEVPAAAQPAIATPTQGESQASGSSSRLVPWILIGAGGGVFVIGAILGTIAVGKAGDAPSDKGSQADGARSLALGADVMMGVGLVAAAVGGTLLLLGNKTEGQNESTTALGPRRGIRFSPVAGPGVAGVRAALKF